MATYECFSPSALAFPFKPNIEYMLQLSYMIAISQTHCYVLLSAKTNKNEHKRTCVRFIVNTVVQNQKYLYCHLLDLTPCTEGTAFTEMKQNITHNHDKQDTNIILLTCRLTWREGGLDNEVRVKNCSKLYSKTSINLYM